MTNTTLTIGMPGGSLADPNRGGNLIALLKDAGFKTRGYESGGPSSFTTTNYLFGWDGRPQEFGSQLAIGELDVAIAGDDWIQERILELKLEYDVEVALEKVLSMKRGEVRLVGITNNDHDFDSTAGFLSDLCARKSLITVVSEMPYLALNWIQQSLLKAGLDQGQFARFSVQKYKSPAKIEQGILIYETWGKTEAKIKNGGADMGLEITQSGSAIRNYGLKIIEEVLTSETGIWIDPKVRQNPEKLELLKMFLLNLYGSINAESKVLIIFNVPNASTEAMEIYLRSNNLFADEPTLNKGSDYTEYSIQVDSANSKIPLAKVRYELAKLGAKNIDTIPIDSSIPGIDVITL